MEKKTDEEVVVIAKKLMSLEVAEFPTSEITRTVTIGELCAFVGFRQAESELLPKIEELEKSDEFLTKELESAANKHLKNLMIIAEQKETILQQQQQIEALDKANTEKESQIVSLQDRIDFQVEANDILYADHAKELKNVIAGKAALQSKYDALIFRIGEINTENPYPESVFPMTTEEYTKAIPDEKLRTAISGFMGRYIWNVAIKEPLQRIQAIIEQSKGKE